MPICSYGGARCEAGPGATGPAETVHEHELTYHDKHPGGMAGRGKAPILTKRLYTDQDGEFTDYKVAHSLNRLAYLRQKGGEGVGVGSGRFQSHNAGIRATGGRRK